MVAGVVIRVFVFLSSGFVHGFFNWVTGNTCAVNQEMYEYVQFAAAIVAEDVVVRTYQAWFGKADSPFALFLFRVLGRLWVFAVMFVVVADADIKIKTCEEALRWSRRN
jgi:hypothetical protein